MPPVSLSIGSASRKRRRHRLLPEETGEQALGLRLSRIGCRQSSVKTKSLIEA
jgi:hypothetical protein